MSHRPKPKPKVRPKVRKVTPESRAAKVINSLPKQSAPPAAAAPQPIKAEQSEPWYNEIDPKFVAVGALIVAGIAYFVYKQVTKKSTPIDPNEYYIERMRRNEEEFRERAAKQHAENFPKQALELDESLVQAAPVQEPPIATRHRADPPESNFVPVDTGAERFSGERNQIHSRDTLFRIQPIDIFTLQ